MARLIGKDHGDMLRYADGYMTAWFIYHFKGDEYAGGAFFGENAEISTNTNWQNVKIGESKRRQGVKSLPLCYEYFVLLDNGGAKMVSYSYDALGKLINENDAMDALSPRCWFNSFRSTS